MSSNTESSTNPGFLSLSLSFLKFFGSCISLWGIGYMRFSAAWVAVGSLGYFLIQVARNKRVGLTGSLKAIGENEKKFILEHFSVRDLPSWVYFPDVERAEWFNKVVKRLWPFLSDYAKDIILQNVAPAVSAQLPAALKPFSFITIDLGDTPPRVGGVKVYMDESIRRDEVVIDLDVMLYSDARVKVQLGKIKAGIKEFELRGTLRVILKPLVSSVPFFGAVTVCFLDSPYINFSLTDMGNLLGLPGIQQTLNTVIHNVVNDMIVLPNRLPIQLMENVDVRRLRYPLPQGLIRVNVIAARNLKVGDTGLMGGGSSDPYCIIRVGARTFETKVKQKTLHPEWNEHFETLVDVRRGQFLEVEVYDKDQSNKDDLLGSASISLESVHDSAELDTWVKLEDVKTGSVHLKLNWFSLSDRMEDVATAMQQAAQYRALSGAATSSGYLYVVVEEGKNLMRLKHMREPSPYCNLILGRELQNTEVKDYTQSPYWDSVHQFLVGDPHVDILQITVRDGRTEAALGKCSIPIRSLLSENRMSIARPFQLDEAGPDGAMLFLHLEFKAFIPKKVVPAVTSTSLSISSTKTTPDGTDGLTGTNTNSVEPDSVLRKRTNTTDTNTQRDAISAITNAVQPVSTEDSRISASRNSSDLRTLVSDSVSTSGNLHGMTAKSQQEDYSASPLGRVQLTFGYNTSTSTLSVTVHQARNLLGVDKDGLADPYVKLLLLNQRGAVKTERKTNFLKDTLNPVYEESLEFEIDQGNLYSYGLRVDVKNHVGRFTTSGRKHQMGSAYVELSRFASNGTVTEWFPLAPLNSISYGDTRSLSSE